MELNKKDTAIIILSFSILLSGVGNILLGGRLGFPKPVSPEREILIVGTSAGPVDLDPIDSWDEGSNRVIRQVCETLFFNNLSDPDLPRLNWLCESYSWDDNVTLRINIRTGIKFHDGTTMDATACAWNIDRLIYLCNHTGEMPAGPHRAKIHSLYEFPSLSSYSYPYWKEIDPIFNSTEVVDTTTFKIYLNAPYTQTLAAMAYSGCSILSPSSTPFDHFLDKASDDLIGTGPFMYNYYILDDEVHFTRFDDYWGSPANSGPAYFEEMIFNVIDDSTTRNLAMVNGTINYISGTMIDFYKIYNNSPYITFHEHQYPNLGLSYLSMNNDVFTITDGDKDDANFGINKTWRKAISYAINYTYIVEEMYDNQVVRAYSPISSGFGPYYDPEIEKVAPYCNYTIARQVIIDGLKSFNSVITGLPNTQPGTIADQRGDDDAWEDVTLISFNYTYNTDNWFRSELHPLLKEWLGKIGIYIEDGGFQPPIWWVPTRMPCKYYPLQYECLDYLYLFWLGWGPDYPDPMNMIQPLISNNSWSKIAQVNDPWIEAQIIRYNTDFTLNEMDKIEIIHNITKYLVTELYPHVYGVHTKVYNVHSSDLLNVPYNSLGQFWAYPITRYDYSQWSV